MKIINEDEQIKILKDIKNFIKVKDKSKTLQELKDRDDWVAIHLYEMEKYYENK